MIEYSRYDGCTRLVLNKIPGSIAGQQGLDERTDTPVLDRARALMHARSVRTLPVAGREEAMSLQVGLWRDERTGAQLYDTAARRCMCCQLA